MEVVLRTRIKGLNMCESVGLVNLEFVNQHVCLFYLYERQNQGEAYKSDSHVP